MVGFNLSECIENEEMSGMFLLDAGKIKTNDVKEFIKLLKELLNGASDKIALYEEIDKLAGEKLCN